MNGSLPALFDAHFHVIDPRFPLVANHGYLPPPFTVDDYLAASEHLGLVGGAVVSGSFQHFDQRYLIDALDRLGPRFVGVTQLPDTVTDEELLHLEEVGVRAVRFNLHRCGSDGLQHLDALARRVHEIARWHAELYLDARNLPDLMPTLSTLPQVSIDHLGISGGGLPYLLDLVERGAKVKASGFGRCDMDIRASLRAVAAVNPGALMVGSDLPSTRAPRPFSYEDLVLVCEALGAEIAAAAFSQNALELYRPAGQVQTGRGL